MWWDQRASHAQTFNLFLDRLAAEKAKTVDGRNGSQISSPFSLLFPLPQFSDFSPSQHASFSFLFPEQFTPSPSQGCSLQTPSMHISTSLSNDEIFESKSYIVFLSPKPVMLLDTYEVLNKDLLLNILQMKTKELRETSLILSY